MSTTYTAPRPELQDALFLYACTGDGARSTLIRGWNALVTTVVSEVAGDDWDQILADPDEWLSDGADQSYFMLLCHFEDGSMKITRVHEASWMSPETAPKDGSMLRLLVEFDAHPMDDNDSTAQVTIGMNNMGNTGVDEWQFAGWCWTHDRFTQGEGRVVGWLPLL